MWLSTTISSDSGLYVIVAIVSAPSRDTTPLLLETGGLPVTRSHDSWLPSRSHIDSGRSGTPENSNRSSWRYARYKFIRGGFTIRDILFLRFGAVKLCKVCKSWLLLQVQALSQIPMSKRQSVGMPSGRCEEAALGPVLCSLVVAAQYGRQGISLRLVRSLRRSFPHLRV
jgi:hypothetical protein